MKFTRADLPFGLRAKPTGRVFFQNDDYVRAHGRTPRGRGLWAFECVAARVDLERLTACVHELGMRKFHLSFDRATASSRGRLLRLWVPDASFVDASSVARWVLGVCCACPLVGLVVEVAP